MAPLDASAVSPRPTGAATPASAAATKLSSSFRAVTSESVEPVAHIENDIESIAQEWDDLADRVGASPFMRPGWMTAWWRAFGRGDLVIVTARRDGRLTGVLPLERLGRALSALANHHSPSYGPIAEDRAATRALAERTLGEMPSRLELFMLGDQDEIIGELLRAGNGARHPALSRVIRRTPYLSVDSHSDGALASLGRRGRKELRRQRRRLEDQGAVELEIIRDQAALEQAFGDLLALEGSGWKVERGTAIASQPRTRDFYREIATWAAARGYLALFFLTVDGPRIAVDLCLEDAGVRYMLKGGFGTAYASVSPGNLLRAENLTQGFAAGMTRIELGGGSDAYKLRWTSATVPFCQVQIFSSRARRPAAAPGSSTHTRCQPRADSAIREASRAVVQISPGRRPGSGWSPAACNP